MKYQDSLAVNTQDFNDVAVDAANAVSYAGVSSDAANFARIAQFMSAAPAANQYASFTMSNGPK